MGVSQKLNDHFPSQQYAPSPIADLLTKGEINIIWYDRDHTNSYIYDTFNNDFRLFLSKLPQNNVKKYVSTVFDENLVFVGVSKVKSPVVFSRVLRTRASGDLAGIVIDSGDIDINLATGEASSIDDCIYATYFAIIRAAILNNKDAIQKEKDLHKTLVLFLFQSLLKALGKGTVYSPKHREFIMLTCAYIFYRHYFKQKHLSAISFVKRNFKDNISPDTMKEALEYIGSSSKYSTIQDIPKVLIDMKVITTNPNQVTLALMRILSNKGYYCVSGSLDFFIGFVILLRYPSGLFPKTGTGSDKIHKNVEDVMVKYMNKIKYNTKIIMKEY